MDERWIILLFVVGAILFCLAMALSKYLLKP